MKKVLEKIGAGFKWLGQNLWAVIGVLVAALGAGIFWSYHRGKTRRLEDEKAIAEAHARVAALDARREALGERVEENREELAAIEEERKKVRAEAVALAHDVSEMSDEEVERAFRDLY